MKIPRTFKVNLFLRKSCSVRGENCEEYIVRTIMIVEKDMVVMAKSEPARVERMDLARSRFV
ncbi:MAG: hypothetical protein UMV23_03245 [Halanaerobium sp.]|nr:hypothetical protein [Halanaerobium sp.]